MLCNQSSNVWHAEILNSDFLCCEILIFQFVFLFCDENRHALSFGAFYSKIHCRNTMGSKVQKHQSTAVTQLKNKTSGAKPKELQS